MADKINYIFGKDVSDEYPKVTIGIERVTPELAEQWLGTNMTNRTMPREPIAEAIKIGEWMMNGETIIFSWEGNLIDGQTRLHGCIQAGKPIDTVVVRGVDPKAQLVMDCGTTRSLTAHLEMLGVKNSKVIGAITKPMYRLEHWGVDSAISGSHTEMTTRTLIGYAVENDEMFQELWKEIKSAKLRHSSLTTGMLAVLDYEFKKVDAEDCEEFLAQLACDRQMSQPVNLMVKKLDEDAKSKTGKYPARTIGALLIKTWNAFLNGIEIDGNYLRFRAGGKQKEQFPEIAHY